MNPIPPSLPSYNPPARDAVPARIADDSSRIQEFEKLLDRQATSSTERSLDHLDQPSAREAHSSRPAEQPKKADPSKQDGSGKEAAAAVPNQKTLDACASESEAFHAPQGETVERHHSEDSDGPTVDAAGDSPSTLEPTGTLLADAVHARKKHGHGGDEASGGDFLGSQYGASVAIAADHSIDTSRNEVTPASITEAVGRIEQISELIAQTAQQVTFDGNDRASITLSPKQLPDSKLIIQMTQQVVQVTFLSDNASSLSLLQARGGEVAAALAMRFDREIRIEVKDGGDGSDAGDSSSSRASWTVQGNSGNGSSSANA
jgi:hypothetical protein